ncbi:hypothetical protein QJS10_CPB19g01672 [Acorus calamus]|uniref:Uncharacterized protein n=1 Tax=Acorus calamus TaxID=4465 RepID=A0AAV9CKQ2_ACOCL|nr:hypothetical protein QJS10_CPB19g01672 [Acorus calamus]
MEALSLFPPPHVPTLHYPARASTLSLPCLRPSKILSAKSSAAMDTSIETERRRRLFS